MVGLLTTAFVLSLTVKHIAEEIKTFRMWERLKASAFGSRFVSSLF